MSRAPSLKLNANAAAISSSSSSRYMDTDSIVIFAASVDLRECVLVGRLEEYDAVKDTIFEDSTSPTVQACRLKLEGKGFRLCYYFVARAQPLFRR